MAALAATMSAATPAGAVLLDFTDQSFISGLTETSGSFSGSVAGIGFNLSTTDAAGINFDEASVGGSCDGSILACQIDGAGIGDDEIRGVTLDSGQEMLLSFNQTLHVGFLYFLDLFSNQDGTEQAKVSFDGGAPLFFDGVLSGDGGFLASNAGLPVTATSILFTALDLDGLRDDRTNDYALAGLSVSAVPLPAALPLFAAALGGFGLLSRRRRKPAGA